MAKLVRIVFAMAAVLVSDAASSVAVGQDLQLPNAAGNCETTFMIYKGVCVSTAAIREKGAAVIARELVAFRERNAVLLADTAVASLCQTTVVSRTDDIIKLDNGAVLEATSYLGYIGYRPEALLVGNGASRSLLIGDSEEAQVSVLREPTYCSSPSTYRIDAAANDETFIINSEHFEAQTFCLSWAKDDRVVFLQGSAFGACATATLYNINRSEMCKVWCE